MMMTQEDQKDIQENISFDGLNMLLQSRDDRAEIERLKQCLKDLKDKKAFAVGDIVTWKGGFKNRNFPAYGTPAVVVDCFDPPIMDPEPSAGSQYYREPLDVRLGFIAEDDSFVTFLYDSRRFDYYEMRDERISKGIAMIRELLNKPSDEKTASNQP